MPRKSASGHSNARRAAGRTRSRRGRTNQKAPTCRGDSQRRPSNRDAASNLSVIPSEARNTSGGIPRPDSVGTSLGMTSEKAPIKVRQPIPAPVTQPGIGCAVLLSALRLLPPRSGGAGLAQGQSIARLSRARIEGRGPLSRNTVSPRPSWVVSPLDGRGRRTVES